MVPVLEEGLVHKLIERISRVIADVGSNTNLDMVGRINGLEAFINKNPSDKDKDGPLGALTMASTVEAIIGAVYLDGNMKSVSDVMQNLGLMPRLVRRTGKKVPISESVKPPAASAPAVQNEEEPEVAPRDWDETLAGTIKSSQALVKALRDYLLVIQLKKRRDDNAQSTP